MLYCEEFFTVIFGLLLSIWVFIAVKGSFWSLRSEKQMDIKLFTESFKKNDPSKNMEDSFSSCGTKSAWETPTDRVVLDQTSENGILSLLNTLLLIRKTRF